MPGIPMMVIARLKFVGERGPKLVALLNAVLDGVKGADLRTRLKVDAKGLASLRKQLKRKLASAAVNRSVP